MGLAEPLALAFAGLYGVLVLFYLWERWRRRIAVPSLLLWDAVREDVIRARRFRPDLLFVLQALLLACLIAGLARPYVVDSAALQGGSRHILVLDTTASMQAREARTTRFEQARERALHQLRSLPAEDEVMLITAGNTPEVLAGFSRDHAAAAQALTDAVATDTGGDLGLAVAFANSARQRSDLPTDVAVFTDIPRSQLPPALRDEVTVFQVGESDDNIGIESLQVFQGRFQDYRSASLQVRVRNYAHRDSHGWLTVQLENQVVHRTGFTLLPRDSQAFVVRNFPGPGRVVASLDAEDALAADNSAYGWIRPVSTVRVLVVSPPSPLLDDLHDLAAATPGLVLTVIGPKDALPTTPFDLAIFHRAVPSAPLAVNALYIYPPAENTLFPVAAEATNIEVIDWNTHHAALQSVRPLAALPLQRARVMAPPEWSQVLLWSRTTDREFPLAFAGEHDGHRIVCLTFDLEAERLLSSDNINFFLFFLNVLGWLTPESRDATVVNTGDVYRLDDLPPRPVPVHDPRGVESVLPAGATTLIPRFAGEYRIGLNGTSRVLLANLLDPVESDIGRASHEAPVVAALPQRTGAAVLPPPPGFGRWFYAAAAGLFLLEWVAGRRSAR